MVSGKLTSDGTVGIAYETFSSAIEGSVDFQADSDQKVEVSTHVDKESLVVNSDGSKNKKKKKVCGNYVGYRALYEEIENVIFLHDTTK